MTDQGQRWRVGGSILIKTTNDKKSYDHQRPEGIRHIKEAESLTYFKEHVRK